MVKAKLRSAGASDPGRVRRNNEDAWHLDADRGIFFVVDGIGGQAAGEKAAEIAVSRLRARLERQTGTAEQRVREAITMANNEILQAAAQNPEWSGMACVLTVAVLDENEAVVGHVGDSRLYQIRQGRIQKVTHDHSPVGEREDRNELSEAEAMRHPRRNEVFRDVGSETHNPDDADFIEVRRIPFDTESALLLCSDGLSDQVPSADILRSVERHAGDPDTAVRELILAANQAGGKDNVTVVLVEGDEFAAQTPPKPEPAPSPVRWLWIVLALAVGAAGGFVAGRRTAPRPVPVNPAPRSILAGDGTPLSIMAALAAAHPGDTVEVQPGEYHEQVRLRGGVTLRSRVPLEATLRTPALSPGPAVIAQDVQNARLSGFRLTGDGPSPLSAGILLINSEVEIDNVEVQGAGTGVEVRGGRGVSLSASVIEDCLTDGLVISGSDPWISHTIFRRNKHAGLAARDGAAPVLRDNIFEKNTVELPPEMMEAVKANNQFVDIGTTRRSELPRKNQ